MEGEATGWTGAGPWVPWVTCLESSSLSSTGTRLWGLVDGMEAGVGGDTVEQKDQPKELGCSSREPPLQGPWETSVVN